MELQPHKCAGSRSPSVLLTVVTLQNKWLNFLSLRLTCEPPARVFNYRKIWNKKEIFFAVSVEGHVTEFVKDEVSHAVVDKEVAVTCTGPRPLPGLEQPEEGSIQARTPPRAGVTT